MVREDVEHKTERQTRQKLTQKLTQKSWGQISHAKKQQDLRLANVQTAIARAGIAVTKCIDVLLEARKKNAPP